MAKPFASSADTEVQRAQMTPLAEGVYGYISSFDPNTGLVVTEEGCLVIDCRATPLLAREWLEEIQKVTDRPVTRIFLTHYHAVRVLGRAAFGDVHTVIASAGTAGLIEERGQEDFESEVRRFPRLFDAVEEVPGLTTPNVVFPSELTLRLGGREIQIAHVGRGHTAGDSVLWLPQERVLFAGDLVEDRCALYCGDAYLQQWRATLEHIAAFGAQTLVPGRGAAIVGTENVARAITMTRGFLDDLLRHTEDALSQHHETRPIFDHVYAQMTPTYGQWPIYEHCIPFNVSRAIDEIRGVAEPTVWTAERDKILWNALQS